MNDYQKRRIDAATVAVCDAIYGKDFLFNVRFEYSKNIAVAALMAADAVIEPKCAVCGKKPLAANSDSLCINHVPTCPTCGKSMSDNHVHIVVMS